MYNIAVLSGLTDEEHFSGCTTERVYLNIFCEAKI